MIVINRSQLRHVLSTEEGRLLSHGALLNYEKTGVIPEGKKMGNTYIYSVEEIAKHLSTSKESIVETVRRFNNSKKTLSKAS